MSLDVAAFGRRWLPQIETELRASLVSPQSEVAGMYALLRYHMGWEDAQGQGEMAAQGKRVRPLLLLMAAQAAGGDPAAALPAAAAVELLHNFSLIHDDIEDNSPTRRHRPTLWTWAGVAQAINAGDALFILARLTLLGLADRGVPSARVLLIQRLFDRACLHLTEGQYLDIGFETRAEVSAAEYMTMIGGKTAALLAASAQLGALTAGAAVENAAHFWWFGHELGLSFQVQDDILGIWGDEAQTGKSAASDILARKKTLPVLHALAQSGPDAAALRVFYASDREITAAELPAILALLDRLGAQATAAAAAAQHAQAALAALAEIAGDPAGIALLRELALILLGRHA